MAYMRGYPTGKQPFPKVRLVENEYPSNAIWKTSIKNLKEYKHNFKVINEWMNEESWMRGQQTCPIYNTFLTCEKYARTSAYKRRHWQPLSVHLWAYCTHQTHDVNDVMCEGWPQHRGLRPLLFSNSGVGSFTSYKNQISASAVRRDLRFFVLIREVRTRDFPLSRPALFQLSQPGGSKWRQTAVMFTPYRIKSFLVQYEQQRHRTGTSRSRTSNVVPYRLTERVRLTKSSISHKHIQTTTINENRSLISSIKINKNR